MDPGTKRLMVIAGGLGGTLLVIVGSWSLLGHRAATVPVVQADTHPIRVKPDNPGGMQVAGANEDILSGGAEAGTGKLAPPPEAPAPQALRTPPPQPVPPSPPVVASAPPSALVATAVPAKPPVKPSAAMERPPAAPVQEHPAQAGAKGVLVQLAAVRSEDAAKSEWQRLSKRMPELLGQHRPAFTKIERDGQALWRVRTGGFNDISQATQFCAQVRAKGASCSVADF